MPPRRPQHSLLYGSIRAFLGFLFLTLVLTVGYAVTGISGPEASILNAESAFRAGRYSEAVKTLDMAEKSLPKGNSQLRRRLLQKRADALIEVGNLPLAVQNLDWLRLCYDKPQLGIENERLEMLIRMGKGKEALQAAHELLAKSEEASRDSRSIELLGEAAQAVYQKIVEDLKAELRQVMGGADYIAALRSLRTFAFREGDDPIAQRARVELEVMLRKHNSTLMVSGRGQELIRDIQQGVAESQTAFRQALEIRGNPASAFLGFAYSLEQGGRDDDLIAESEIYQRRFDNGYVLAAADAAADAHERHGRPRAVIELIDRVLPGESWRERQKRDALHPSIKSLLLRKARAQHALGDTLGLSLTRTQSLDISNAKDPRLPIFPELYLILAFHDDLIKNWADVPIMLGQYCGWKEVKSDRDEDHDALTEGLSLWASAIQKLGNDLKDLSPVVRIWSEDRPLDPTPFVMRARLLLASGNGDAAGNDAQSASKLAPRDEGVLRLWAEATALHFDLLERGPKSLLHQCLSRGTTEPSNPQDRLLFMPLAELALRTGNPRIAMDCARRAQDHFSLASWPRYIYADAALALDQPREAEKAMAGLLEQRPDDLGAQRRLRKARAAQGFSTIDLLYGAMSDPQLDPDLAGAIAKAALEREDTEVLPGIVRCLLENFPGDAESMLRVAEAYARAGRGPEAKQILLKLAELFPNDRKRRAEAARRYVLLCARGGEQKELAIVTPALRQLASGDVPMLTATAEELASLGCPAAASELIDEVLDAEVEPGQRSGRHFLLAGRLALAGGRLAVAEDRLTAALAFQDGAQATRLLVPLLLAADRATEAQRAWWREKVDDQSSACIALRLGLGATATGWIEARRKREPTDLHLAFLALAANPDAPGLRDVLPDAAEIAKGAKDALLDCLLFGETKGLEPLGLARANTILARYPKSRTARWLLAHTEARAGRVQDACTRLLSLAGDEPDFVAAVDELAWIVLQPNLGGYDSHAVLGQIVASASRYKEQASPRMIALAGREVASQMLHDLGLESPGLRLLAQVWIEHPETSGAGKPEVEALIRAGRTEEALRLLDSQEPLIPPYSRPQFLDFWFKMAVAILATNPERELTERLLQKAREIVLDSKQPYGSALHFMIRMERAEAAKKGREEESAVRARSAKIRDLLRQQIHLFELGRDPSVESVLASLDEIKDIDGIAVALAESESILRKNPALPQIWRRRAELLAQHGRPGEAIELLRRVWSYTREPILLLMSTELACENAVPVNEAESRLDAGLPASLAQSPRGCYVRGLLALRSARYDAAVKLLEGVEPRSDGAHLWYAALANLSSRATGSQVKAMELLQRLFVEYPRSLLATNARHFVAQLRLI